MKVFRKILLIMFLVIMSIVLILIGQGYKMYKEAINIATLTKKINGIQSQENYTKLSEIPQTYVNAVIAVEDHRFYEHIGIDIIAIGRATFNDIKAMRFLEGGSTVTQQLAKNIYFTQEKKITRKIAEVFMTFEIEKRYDKDEILELYINTIYYGNGYYNIKDASLGYFGKLPKDLSDGECIMLAGIPNAPSVYNPKVNPELARQRQKQVIQKMIKYGKLSESEADIILNEK